MLGKRHGFKPNADSNLGKCFLSDYELAKGRYRMQVFQGQQWRFGIPEQL